MLRKFIVTLAVVAATLGGATFVGVQTAAAISAPIHVTSTVNMRPGPSTASGSPIATIPSGASPDYHCWAQGQNISGVDVWFNVTYGGHTGYYASYYDSSSYTADSQITTKYGIPQCGTTTSPTITIRGGVSCSYHAVTGVWVQSSTGGSKYASWQKSSPGGYGAAFSATLTVKSLPTSIQLHVGCGTGSTAGSWWSDNWTPSTSTSGSRTLDAICNEGTTQPAAGANTRCTWVSVGTVILNAAKAQSGRTYCWAGGTTTGPSHGSTNLTEAPKCGASTTIGFDCTGLTLYAAFHATNVLMPHDGTQATYAVSHGATRITSTAALQPGDIVFLGGSWSNFAHSGIYAGNGQVWDANTAFWVYGDGVQLRTLASMTTSLPFVGAARF